MNLKEILASLPFGKKTSTDAGPAQLEIVSAYDLGGSKLLGIEAGIEGDHLRIAKINFLRPENPEQSTASLLKVLFEDKGFNREEIRTSIKGQGIVTRFIRFPKMTQEDFRNSLQYELAQYIPFDPSDVIVQFAIIDDHVRGEEGEMMDVLLAAAKKQDFEALYKKFNENYGCSFELVDMDILAILGALEYFHPDSFNAHTAVLDIGSEMSTVAVVRNGKPRFIRDISFGMEDILKRFNHKAGMQDLKAAREILEKQGAIDEALMNHLVSSVENLIGDVRISLDYYRDQLEEDLSIGELYLSGNMANSLTLQKVLTEDLGLQVKNMDLMNKMMFDEGVDIPEVEQALPFLPVVLGLVVRRD